MGTSYELVVEIAQRIEGARQRAREQATRDKRFWYSEEFSGAPSRGKAIQGSSSGYSGHQGQASGQQSTVLRGCYECEDPGHMKRFCLRLRGKVVQQGHQPMITAPAAPPAVRPPRGGGQVGRGHPRGGGQAGGGQSGSAPAKFYAFPARPDAVASNAVITVGDSVVVDQINRSCTVTFCGYETRTDLLLLDMADFEVILSMNWLSLYHVILDFHAKFVTLAMPEFPRLEWKGSFVSTPSRIISFMKARHMVEKGYLAYLAYVRDTIIETPAIDSVSVVQEFSDVFPSDLLGTPPDRDIDFCIDLAPSTQLISIPAYPMAPKELKELKEQLEDLLAKGFVRLSVSPWGCTGVICDEERWDYADVH
ncbi:uncharacterized protein [Nicotiana tomentosiformis]|uniref:uncharacterized protein n=1 Tax=Nicotiana tomentosiformis TaxID=4098 RepID=UPI00388CABC7